MFETLVPAYTYSMRARNLAPKTQDNYLECIDTFETWLAQDSAPPESPATVKRRDLQRYIAWLVDNFKGNTPNNRYQGLRQFFIWLQDEEEIGDNPFAGLSPPRQETKEDRVLSTEELQAMLDTCDRKTFMGSRDLAMIRVLIDTGMRRQELTGIYVTHLDMDVGEVFIPHESAKGSKERTLVLGTEAMESIHRYVRHRDKHPHTDSPKLWIGRAGALKPRAVGNVIEKRSRDAGLPQFSPHVFRHTLCHRWLAAGGTETGLMRIMGWSSRQMVQRYAASTQSERARDEARRLNLGGLD